MDLKFDSTKDAFMGKTVVNTSDANEHVIDIERFIRTMKEI